MQTKGDARPQHDRRWMLAGAGCGAIIGIGGAAHAWVAGREVAVSALVGVGVQALAFAAAARGLCWLWLRREAAPGRRLAMANPASSITVPTGSERWPNRTRGLFRVWVVCSVAWACIPLAAFFTKGPGMPLFSPLPPYSDCQTNVRASLANEPWFPDPWNKLGIGGTFPARQLFTPDNRVLTIEEARCVFTEANLRGLYLNSYYDQQRDRILTARKEFAETWWQVLLAMALPPVAVLLFAWVAFRVGSWVARGFRPGPG